MNAWSFWLNFNQKLGMTVVIRVVLGFERAVGVKGSKESLDRGQRDWESKERRKINKWNASKGFGNKYSLCVPSDVCQVALHNAPDQLTILVNWWSHTHAYHAPSLTLHFSAPLRILWLVGLIKGHDFNQRGPSEHDQTTQKESIIDSLSMDSLATRWAQSLMDLAPLLSILLYL